MDEQPEKIAAKMKTGACAGMPSQRSWPRNRNDSGKFVNASAPRVMASASPRNSEKVPSVTMSGGNRSHVINVALSPPPSAPTQIVQAAASGIDIPASRQNFPNKIAHKLNSEATDRSIPPVKMIGVIASASSPISHECRKMSQVLS